VASFVYLECLYYVRKDAVANNTKPVVLAKGWQRKRAVRISRKATA